MRILIRVVLSTVLLVAIGVLGVHYSQSHDAHWPYPDDSDLAVSYDRYIGEKVFLFTEVESVDQETETATVTVGYGSDTFPVEVQGFDDDVSPGGIAQVYGTVRPERTIQASEVVVVNPSAESGRYKLGVSVVGALLVVAVFLRHWRIDLRTLSFETRSHG